MLSNNYLIVSNYNINHDKINNNIDNDIDNDNGINSSLDLRGDTQGEKQKIEEKKREFEQQEKLLAQQKKGELETLSLLNKMQNTNTNEKEVKNNQVTEEMILLNKKMEL